MVVKTMPASAVRDDGRRLPADKFDARRDELAGSALVTLAERGFSRTSLRDIAQNSPFSHGVVHYYFKDKTELILYCVRSYKRQCITRYDSVVEFSTTPDELLDGFVDKLVETMVGEGRIHRLWYDIRAESMFDERMSDDVRAIDAALENMIWRVVSTYATLAGREASVDSGTAYAMFDGLFEQALVRHLAGSTSAAAELRTRARTVLPMLLRGHVDGTPRGS